MFFPLLQRQMSIKFEVQEDEKGNKEYYINCKKLSFCSDPCKRMSDIPKTDHRKIRAEGLILFMINESTSLVLKNPLLCKDCDNLLAELETVADDDDYPNLQSLEYHYGGVVFEKFQKLRNQQLPQ